MIKVSFVNRLNAVICLLVFAITNFFLVGFVGAVNLDQEDIDAIYNNTVFFDSDSVVCSPDASGLDANDNVAKAYLYFMQKGFSNEQTSGILGNLAGESGLNPQNVQNTYTTRTGTQDGEHNPLDLWWWGTDENSGEQVRRDAGYGIAQWTNISRKERFVALADYLGADSQGNVYGSLENQLDLVWYELTGKPDVPGFTGGNYRHAYDHLLSTNTIEEAAISWVQHYERPRSLIENENLGYDHLVNLYRDDRIKFSEDIFNKYSGVLGGSDGCVGSGELNSFTRKIVEYAWPFVVPRGSYREIPPKQEYIDAIRAAASLPRHYEGGANGIDCGAFVTRVIRDSGIDPNYNYYASNTVAQERYLRESWQEIEVGSTADLQPGDVAMWIYPPGYSESASGHTFVFIGNIPGFETNVASSALESRSPASGSEDPMDDRYTWYRRN